MIRKANGPTDSLAMETLGLSDLFKLPKYANSDSNFRSHLTV